MAWYQLRYKFSERKLKMPFDIYTGRAGAGKSLSMAEEILRKLKRNWKFWKRSGKIRPIYSNLRINPEIVEQYKVIYDTGDQNEFLHYYVDSQELLEIRDADVFIDEIGTYFDAQEYKNMSPQLKRWIQQHRKRGVEITATAQDFAQLDKSFRRLTDKVFYNVKVIGSRDVSATKPPPKWIWGLIIQREINPTDYNEDDKAHQAQGFTPFLITRKKTEVFDTTQDISPSFHMHYKHMVRSCPEVGCGYQREVHV